MFRIQWLKSVFELYEELPTKDRTEIQERLTLLQQFPEMYPFRYTGRFRRHRFFVAGKWLVYYKHVGDTVFIRALWPGRIPY